MPYSWPDVSQKILYTVFWSAKQELARKAQDANLTVVERRKLESQSIEVKYEEIVECIKVNCYEFLPVFVNL